MAVTIVYRSHYDDPSGKRVKRFEDATVLDWFRNHWAELSRDDADKRLPALIGFDIYGFPSLFGRAHEQNLPAPKDDAQLGEYLAAHLYSEGPILAEPHRITVQTDDDELEVCYYIFDDAYLAEHGARAAYLLNEGWRLPAEHAEAGTFEPSEPTLAEGPTGGGTGATYLVLLTYEDSANLSDMRGASRIEGVRIPDLARYLCVEDDLGDASDYLLLVRSQLLATPLTADPFEEGFRKALLEDLGDEATWGAYSDWLQEQGERQLGLTLLEQALKSATHFPVADMDKAWKTLRRVMPISRAHASLQKAMSGKKPGRLPDPAKSHVQVEEHLAQLCIHTETWGKEDLYQQWIFFDDLWAARHPDLANALLRFARTWDVLSSGEPHDDDDD
jgi:uncharacterized protein (TIGR02996 family)